MEVAGGQIEQRPTSNDSGFVDLKGCFSHTHKVNEKN